MDLIYVIPKRTELNYRKKLVEDEKTMEYNNGIVPFPKKGGILGIINGLKIMIRIIIMLIFMTKTFKLLLGKLLIGKKYIKIQLC